MRFLISASIITFASALAVTSTACDRHGGMFGQLGGAAWTDYNPASADAEALFLEEQLSEWHKQNAVPPAEVKPTKPSFSKASSRASFAAQARLAKRVKLAKQEKTQPSPPKEMGTTSDLNPR